MATPTPKYTHLSQKNQILKRPGQHIGNIRNTLQEQWIAKDNSIEYQTVNNNPALMHIFYEVLGNAQDNYFRSQGTEHPLKKIKITVDQESGNVTIWNDGLWIPVRVHKWGIGEEVLDDDKEYYEAEIIFGHLNSSSNYDDADQKRLGGGLHGVGVKLTNIFSNLFIVETFDPENKLKFYAEWSENMTVASKPKITKASGKNGWTKITYTADFSKFGIKKYSNDHLSIMKKYCIDAAMITGQSIEFNGQQLRTKSLSDYAKYYLSNDTSISESESDSTSTTSNRFVEFKSGDSTVIVCESQSPGFTQISFVNGIRTDRGGVHVDVWKREIFKAVIDKIKAKYKDVKLTPKSLEQYLMLFVNCNLENPEFDGQTKSVLSSPVPKTDSITPAKINRILKWDFIKNIEESIRILGLKELSKTDGKKTGHVNIKGATDANKAGKAQSQKCTLFIVEGLSAKRFVEAGFAALEHGTDYYGALPIRGKLLNVRGASAKQINDNKEIADIKQILGLKHGVDYSTPTAYKSLRYGRVCILTDADTDGDHIKGLLLNFFHYFYPSLIERGYITSIRTPIVKVKVGKKEIPFYYLKDFKEWSEKNKNKSFTQKYYKGLGTSDAKEAALVFKDPVNVDYVDDDTSTKMMNMVFDKKLASERKKWLENYSPDEFIYEKNDVNTEIVPISDFFNHEMIEFSFYDCQRSIPSIIDGLKPCQRKALWVAFKTNLTSDCKVAQFGAKVAEIAEYHHGETSMCGAIIKMAQTFVGSNNLPLFEESGQFGTRGSGGKDASAPRYIYTRLTQLARLVYRNYDDSILEYLDGENGNKIEPDFFVPIIPMVLVNGSSGIGTAHSSNIPCFNPLEIIDWIQKSLDGETDLPELKPWYLGFKGWTERDDKNKHKFHHYGEVHPCGTNCYEITELPIGVWKDDYEELLNNLKSGISSTSSKTGYEAMSVAQLKSELKERALPMTGTKAELIDKLKKSDKEKGTKPKTIMADDQLIKDWEWHGDIYNINFKVWTKPGVIVEYDNSKFKLRSDSSTSNMTAFMPNGKLKRYKNVEEILEAFCELRLDHYEKRKMCILNDLKQQLPEIQAKADFIDAALQDFSLLKRTEAQLFDYFSEHEYYEKGDGKYNYLTSMQIRSFTADKYAQLIEKIQHIKQEYKKIKKTQPKDMWKSDLDELAIEYKKWMVKILSERKA